MRSHVYFDLDGTLTDPFEGISRCILYALDELGFPHPSNDYLLACIGPPLYDTFPELVGQDLTLRAIDLYRERFNEIGWRENIPYDGIHDALAAIATTDCRLFVATSKPRIGHYTARSRSNVRHHRRQHFSRRYLAATDVLHAPSARVGPIPHTLTGPVDVRCRNPSRRRRHGCTRLQRGARDSSSKLAQDAIACLLRPRRHADRSV